MARIVRLTATSPVKIAPQDFPIDGKSLFLCACGLSQKFPICDGTHKQLRDEDPAGLFAYERVEPAADGSAPGAAITSPGEPQPTTVPTPQSLPAPALRRIRLG